MKKLQKIEWHKIWPYRTFRFLLIFYLGAMTLFFISPNILGIPGLEIFTRELFRFPLIWGSSAYIVGHFFNLVLAFTVISLISNEINFRTMRQNIMDGLSRWQFLSSKMLTIVELTLISTIYLFGLICLMGSINTPQELRGDLFFENVGYIGVYFVQTLGLLTFAAFLTFILQRTALTIIVLLLYIFPVELLIVQNIDAEIANYFPAITIFSTIPANVLAGAFPDAQGFEPLYGVIRLQFYVLIGYIFLYIFGSYMLLKKRDL